MIGAMHIYTTQMPFPQNQIQELQVSPLYSSRTLQRQIQNIMDSRRFAGQETEKVE
jgi:hypothetical protein